MIDTVVKQGLAPLVLRVGLMCIFVIHGMDKVLRPDHHWGLSWKGDALPGVVQLLVAWGELLGGIAVGLGFLTRIAACGLGAIMIGAIVTVHGRNGFLLSNQGYEYNFALTAMCLALLLLGAGFLSLDRLLFPATPSKK